MTGTRMLCNLCCATVALVCTGEVAAVRGTEALATTSPGWADEPSVATALERRGVVHAGRRRLIVLASCVGLRGYGVRVVSFSEHFHRFRCRLWANDGRRYVAWIKVTQSHASTFWWIAFRTRAS